MSDIEKATFDYSALKPELAEMVQEHTGEIRTLARRAAQDIVEIGERLIEVKAVLGHGQFGPWLQAEFNWSPSAASKFMQVAEQFKFVNFTNLDIAPSALYALASGSTPDFIREELIEMARATGEPITHKVVKKRVEEHFSDDLPPEEEVLPGAALLPDPAPETPPLALAPHNAGMAKKEFKPLPQEYEERETMDGSKVLVPKLPPSLIKREVEEENWEAAANRFDKAASGSLSYLRKIIHYDPDLLKKVIASPDGRKLGARARIALLKDAATELLELIEKLEGPQVIDAEPLIEVLPPEKKSDPAKQYN